MILDTISTDPAHQSIAAYETEVLRNAAIDRALVVDALPQALAEIAMFDNMTLLKSPYFWSIRSLRIEIAKKTRASAVEDEQTTDDQSDRAGIASDRFGRLVGMPESAAADRISRDALRHRSNIAVVADVNNVATDERELFSTITDARAKGDLPKQLIFGAYGLARQPVRTFEELRDQRYRLWYAGQSIQGGISTLEKLQRWSTRQIEASQQRVDIGQFVYLKTVTEHIILADSSGRRLSLFDRLGIPVETTDLIEGLEGRAVVDLNNYPFIGFGRDDNVTVLIESVATTISRIVRRDCTENDIYDLSWRMESLIRKLHGEIKADKDFASGVLSAILSAARNRTS
ncbi:hypothetical protein KC959_03540 [Candidatus Saccharibacteria bacterium]|nr:hypothetical protein [Candidatus Saccharibacteria bacterium]